MILECAIGGHRADRDPVYNSGYYFSACRRCGRHLVRSATSDWGTAPPGHRVVWKAGRHSHSIEADYSGVLPIVQEDTQLPVSRSLFASPRRAIVRLRPWRVAPAGAVDAPAPEESGDYLYPRLLLAAVIVGAGLRMLLGFANER